MITLRNKLYDIRFAIGSWFVPKTVYGAVLESSLDAAFDDIKSLEVQLAKKPRSTRAKCNCGN